MKLKTAPAPAEECFKSGEQSETSPFTFVLSTSDVDRAGDIVDVYGISLTHFRKNPVALFGHRHSQIVGTWKKPRIEDGKLLADLELADPGTSLVVDEVRSLLEQRILKAVSIGFSVKEYDLIRDKDDWITGYHFTKTELHEASLVAVPANQHALRLKAVKMGLSNETKNLIFADSGHKTCAPGKIDKLQTGSSPANPKPTQKSNLRGKAMTLGEQIKAKNDELHKLRAQLSEINKKVEDEDGYELTDDDILNIDSLKEAVDAGEKRLMALETLEAAQMVRAVQSKSGTGSDPRPAVGPRPKERKPGDLLIKRAVLQGLAHHQKCPLEQVLDERYKQDDELRAVLKSESSVATTTQEGWAAELVLENINGFMDSLTDISVFAQLRQLGLTQSFDRYGKITVPFREQDDGLAGDFVGETGMIPVKRGAFGARSMVPYKVGVIAPFSKELARRSTPDIENQIERGMREDTAKMLDTRLFDGNAAVPGVRPASIVNGVAGTASAGADGPGIIADVNFLAGTLEDSLNMQRPVLIVHPQRLRGARNVTIPTGGFLFAEDVARGELLGFPVIKSQYAPRNEVILIDAATFAAAYGDLEFETDTSATLVMANADAVTPSHAGGADGVGGTSGQVQPGGGMPVNTSAAAPALSLFQTDSIAVKMTMFLSWAMMRDNAIERVTGVAW